MPEHSIGQKKVKLRQSSPLRPGGSNNLAQHYLTFPFAGAALIAVASRVKFSHSRDHQPRGFLALSQEQTAVPEKRQAEKRKMREF